MNYLYLFYILLTNKVTILTFDGSIYWVYAETNSIQLSHKAKIA